VAELPKHLSSEPVGRERLAREVMVEHQRERVLAAATKVFAKRGYRSTTIDHVVAAAKISVGSFYELFDNKEDCLLQCYDRIIRRAHQEVAAAVPADAPWPEQVGAALRALIEFCAVDPAAARLALIVVQTAGPAGVARYEGSLDAALPWLHRGREHNPIGGQLPDGIEQATVGGLAWFLQQRLEEKRLDPEALYGEMLQLVLEPYLGHERSEELIAAEAEERALA
jgi:AcrR family transcriptional regulator